MLNKTINIGFITRLLTLLSDKDNSVISPYGIAAVLAMAAEGATGNSLNEILTCLGFDTVDELRGAVVDFIKNPCDAFSSENVVTLRKGGDSAKLCNSSNRSWNVNMLQMWKKKMLLANLRWNCLMLQHSKQNG